jgi:hypothetical protein
MTTLVLLIPAWCTLAVLLAVAHGWVRGRRDRERVVHRGSNVTVHPTAYDQDAS